MLAGVSSIYGAGMLEMGITFDLGQLVADNEIVAMSKYLYAGIPVNDLTMVVDEIVEVGPGGDYISRESTLKGMSGLTNSNLIDRQVREAWEAAGSPEFYANAKKEARRILAEHEVEPLPDDVAAEIRTIVQRVDRECGVTFESPV
jgi:trimethylamine--corrinoid protein Co-methyltransferase